MEFESNLEEVLRLCNESKRQTLNNIGTFVTAEAQVRAPVGTSPYDHHKGNLRRSTTYNIDTEENSVMVGATPEAPYAPYVHEGTSRIRNPQPYIKDAVMDNVSKIEEIAGSTFKANMGKT